MPQSTDDMQGLINNIDPATLGRAWGLSRAAVRARLTGKRALTIREIGAVADLVGIELVLHSLHAAFHDDHGAHA